MTAFPLKPILALFCCAATLSAAIAAPASAATAAKWTLRQLPPTEDSASATGAVTDPANHRCATG